MPNEQGYIRSSEIGAFLFCRRAWNLQEQGIPVSDQGRKQREKGTEFHLHHRLTGRKASRARSAALLLLLAAYLLLLIYLFQKFLRR